MVLNWNALRNGVVHSIPYRWMQFENLIESDADSEVIQSFPTVEQFVERQEDGWLLKPSLAQEEVITRMLKTNSGWLSAYQKGEITSDIQDLSEIWQQLIQELWTPAYREIMEELSGLRLENHGMLIAFQRRRLGALNSRLPFPHTDIPDKALTHLLYFHAQWPADWGGSFCVLSNDQPESVVHEISPVLKSSVAIVRSDNSWHMVTPISPIAAHHRLSVQIIFSPPEP